MTDQLTYVEVSCGGGTYSSFESITVTYSADHAARAFSLTATDSNGADVLAESWNFMPGTDITITANGQLVFTGIIDKMTPSYNATAHTVAVSGRSNSKDMIDSDVDHETGELNDTTPIEIANGVNYTSAQYSTDVEQPKIKKFRVNHGEGIHHCVERVCRNYQMILQGMPDGGTKLTKGATGGSNAPLVEGVNILEATATFDESGQHSEYKVHGQNLKGTDKKATQIMASSKGSVQRQRKKTIHKETDTPDKSSAQSRADNHKNQQVGHSTTATVKTQSWFDDGGQVWNANGLVFVESPMLKLNQQMLIKSVSLTQTNSGSFSSLSLTLPSAFGGEGTGMGGSGNTGSGGGGPW
jgi:prophage tail gpP-like protein